MHHVEAVGITSHVFFYWWPPVLSNWRDSAAASKTLCTSQPDTVSSWKLTQLIRVLRLMRGEGALTKNQQLKDLTQAAQNSDCCWRLPMDCGTSRFSNQEHQYKYQLSDLRLSVYFNIKRKGPPIQQNEVELSLLFIGQFGQDCGHWSKTGWLLLLFCIRQQQWVLVAVKDTVLLCVPK